MPLPPKLHNTPDDAANYESAMKQLLWKKLQSLPLSQTIKINEYINFIMSIHAKEQAEEDAPYGEWTEDELRLLSIASLQRVWDEDDDPLSVPGNEA